jgi:tRNA(fMet)-specific endonuclease VapC
MNYLLDTNVCIQFLTGRSEEVRKKIKSKDFSTLYICSVVKGELEYGARKSNNQEKSLTVLHNFLINFPEIGYDSLSAEKYGIIRSDLEKRGLPIGPYDMQIAAIALAHNFTLVSHNVREFQRIEGLLLEDWE